MTIAIAAVLMTFALYVLFLAYCTVNVARKNGKLAMAPRVVQALAYTAVGIGFVLDVLFNIFIGSFMFLELPHYRRLTFTARCKSHLEDQGWRGGRARAICDGWLNPFEAGHC